jgi:high-affinity iron transporter
VVTRIVARLAAAWLCLALAAAAPGAAPVQTAWRLLDYIAVDYREAVAGGRCCNPARGYFT